MLKPAYTLVELLIIVSISGLLIALGTSAYSSAAKRQAIKTAAETIMSVMQTAQKNTLIGQKSCIGSFIGTEISYTAGSSNLTSLDKCEGNNGTLQTTAIPQITFVTGNTILFRPLGEGTTFGSGGDSASVTFRHQNDANNNYQITVSKSGIIKFVGTL